METMENKNSRVPMLRVPLLDALLMLMALETGRQLSSPSRDAIAAVSMANNNVKRYFKWIVVCKLTQLLVAEVDTDIDESCGDDDYNYMYDASEGYGAESSPTIDQLRSQLESLYPSISSLLSMVITAVVERYSAVMSQGRSIRRIIDTLNSTLLHWLEFIRTAAHLLFRSKHHHRTILHPPHLWLLPSDVYSSAAVKADDSTITSSSIYPVEESNVLLRRGVTVTDSQLMKHVILAGLSDLSTHPSSSSNYSGSSSELYCVLSSVQAWLDDLSQHLHASTISTKQSDVLMDVTVEAEAQALMVESRPSSDTIPPSPGDDFNSPSFVVGRRSFSSSSDRKHIHARLHVLQASLPLPQLIPLPSEYTKLHGMITSTIKRGGLNTEDGLSSAGGLGTNAVHLTCRRLACVTTDSTISYRRFP